MAIKSPPVQDCIRQQAELFRRAEKECGLSLPILAARHPDLNAKTMRTWAKTTVMPAWAIGALSTAKVPDHLLSLIFEPFGGHYGSDDEAAEPDAELDSFAVEAAEFNLEVMKARINGGYTHQDKSRLRERMERMGAVLRKVVRRGK